MNPNYNMGEIVVEMIQYVIDSEVYQPPYITWISRNQMIWGNGVHWKSAPAHLKAGLMKHAGITKPSQADLNFQMRRFGYCLEWPNPWLWELPSIMKSDFINKKAKGTGYKDLEFVYGFGYVDPKDGSLDPNHTKAICGWFILHTDKEQYFQTQTDWLASKKGTKDEFLLHQYNRVCSTHLSCVQQQIESGHKKSLINTQLLEQHVYKEIREEMVRRKALPEGEED